MRIVCLIVAVFCVSLSAADASQAPFAPLRHQAEPLSTSLIDLLSQDTDYSLLIRLLQRSRLITTLNALKNATFFAPTNDAVRLASQERPEIALALKDGGVDNIQAKLRATLLYHVLNLTLPYNVSERVDQVDMYQTLLLPHPDEGTGRPGEPPEREGPPDSLLGGEGQRVRITTRSSFKDGNATFVGVDALGQGGVPVVKPVIAANNGHLIGVGAMLEPPKSLRAFEGLGQLTHTGHVIEGHPSLKKLSALLTPELLHNLTTEPHLTIFAPHDSSWEALDELERRYLQSGYATRDTDELVGRHASAVGTGNELPAYKYRLLDAGNASVLSGETVKVKGGNGTALRVNGSRVREYDILASNGVLHIVSDLLLPEGTLALNVEKYLLALNATRFVGLLRSSNLSDYVQSTDAKYTVLAPRDDVLETALTNLPLEGSTKMEELLRYHIIEGQWTPKQLNDGQLLGSVLRPDGLKGSPQRIPVTVAVNALAEPRQGNGDIAFGDANVIASPIVVGNSIIYLISAVLEPPPDVIEAAMGNLRLSTFVAGVYAAHIETQLRRESAISYFIPTNEAFNALGLTMNYLLLKSSLLELRQLIRYHGARDLIYLENVTAVEPIPKEGRITLPTLEGSDLFLDRLANGSASVSGPLIGGVAANGERRPAQVLPSSSPILTDTGVLHVIDQVELPPTLDISIAKLMKGGRASTMIGLLQQAGYDWIAQGDDRPPSNDSVAAQKKKGKSDSRPSYTVLCPTDKAFTKINLTAYLADPEALRTLVKLHVIRSDGPVLETPTQEGHPLRLEDEGGYRTLLSDDGDKYGELTFRSYGGNGDNWLVGIRGARGTGARNDWATVLSFGRSTPKLSGQTRAGGVLLIDSVLIPYNLSWWVRYGWAIAAAVLVVITISGLSFMLWRLWRTKHTRQHCAFDDYRHTLTHADEALDGEED